MHGKFTYWKKIFLLRAEGPQWVLVVLIRKLCNELFKIFSSFEPLITSCIYIPVGLLFSLWSNFEQNCSVTTFTTCCCSCMHVHVGEKWFVFAFLLCVWGLQALYKDINPGHKVGTMSVSSRDFWLGGSLNICNWLSDSAQWLHHTDIS